MIREKQASRALLFCLISDHNGEYVRAEDLANALSVFGLDCPFIELNSFQPLAQDSVGMSQKKLEASLNALSSIEEISQDKPRKDLLTGVDLDDIGMINDKMIRRKVRHKDSYNPGNISILQKFKKTDNHALDRSFDHVLDNSILGGSRRNSQNRKNSTFLRGNTLSKIDSPFSPSHRRKSKRQGHEADPSIL
jgi:hypothetical protein